MAALPTTRLTLADMLKYLDPKGRGAPVVELLAQRGMKEIQGYLGLQPGNLPTGHQFSVRTALPTAYLRDYNDGVTPSKSATAQLTEGMAIIEAWSEVDCAEAKLNGQEAFYRASEGAAFIEAMWQKYVQLFMYGNAKSDSKEFNGLATRFSSLASGNVIDCGGATGTTNTSIYLVNFGEDFFGIYPLGSEGGLQNVDHGRQIIQFSNGNRMAAYVSQYVMNAGLVLRDWRRIVRIANINVTELRARSGTQGVGAPTNIIYAMSDATQLVPDGMGTRVFLCNRTVIACLMKIGLDKSQQVVTIEQGLTQFGKPFQQVSFLGIPLIPVDRMLNTEAKIV